MLPLVQYTCKSKTPPSKNELESSSESVKTDPPTSPGSASLTQMNPLLANSMTWTKKTSRHPYLQPHVLVSPFKRQHHLAELNTPFHSPTTLPPTKPSLVPSQESVTMSTVATHMSPRLKRLFELAEPSDILDCPMKKRKLQHLSPNFIPSEDWNLAQDQIPLHHHHPLTSPFRHLPYRTTHKSWPVSQPPVPESAQWPADWLRPSCLVPMDHGVWGLKLVTWELEYHLFQKVFESELSCCLLACQEELRHRLP